MEKNYVTIETILGTEIILGRLKGSGSIVTLSPNETSGTATVKLYTRQGWGGWFICEEEIVLSPDMEAIIRSRFCADLFCFRDALLAKMIGE